MSGLNSSGLLPVVLVKIRVSTSTSLITDQNAVDINKVYISFYSNKHTSSALRDLISKLITWYHGVKNDTPTSDSTYSEHAYKDRFWVEMSVIIN